MAKTCSFGRRPERVMTRLVASIDFTTPLVAWVATVAADACAAPPANPCGARFCPERDPFVGDHNERCDKNAHAKHRDHGTLLRMGLGAGGWG